MKKDIEDALNTIKLACASVVANLDSHNQIQLAIQRIEEELKSKK